MATDSFERNFTDVRYAVSAVVYGSVGAVGLLLNAVSLWVLLRHHGLGTPCTVFMANLASSDLLLVLSLPARVYFYATASWPLGVEACCAASMLYRFNVRSGSFFITFIGLDRLLAVAYPLRSRQLRSAPNAWRASAVVWLLLLGTAVPESLNFVRNVKAGNASEPTCFEVSVPLPKTVAYLQAGVNLVLLAVNVVSTAMVFRTLRGSLGGDAARVNNRVNVMLLYAVSLLTFVVCFLPMTVVMAIDGGKNQDAIMTAICLASVNCCLDPVLYYFSLDAFWKKIDGPSRKIP